MYESKLWSLIVIVQSKCTIIRLLKKSFFYVFYFCRVYMKSTGGVCLPLVAILNACIQIYNQYNLLVLSGENSALSPR